MAGRHKFIIIKPILLLLSLLFKVMPKFLCLFFWHILMPFNGLLSKSIRYAILKAKAEEIGDNVSIGANTIIKKWHNFKCGNNVSIHENCMIDCDERIEIGNDVSIAHATSLVAANHTWKDKTLAIKYNPIAKEGIVIKNDVWVGCGVRILDGVTINTRSVIAAGAVVNKNVESNSLVGGVPARLIKKI